MSIETVGAMSDVRTLKVLRVRRIGEEGMLSSTNPGRSRKQQIASGIEGQITPLFIY